MEVRLIEDGDYYHGEVTTTDGLKTTVTRYPRCKNEDRAIKATGLEIMKVVGAMLKSGRPVDITTLDKD